MGQVTWHGETRSPRWEGGRRACGWGFIRLGLPQWWQLLCLGEGGGWGGGVSGMQAEPSGYLSGLPAPGPQPP